MQLAAELLLFVLSNFRRLRSAPRGIERRIDFNFSAAHNGASLSTFISFHNSKAFSRRGICRYARNMSPSGKPA